MRLLFDIETNGLLDTVSVVHCLVVKDVDTDKKWSFGPDQIAQGLAFLDRAEVLIGHNILTYDLPVLELVCKWRPQPGVLIRDTLVISRLIWTALKEQDAAKKRPHTIVGRHSLKAWGVRLGVLKGDFGETTDWAQWTPEMQAYCEQDVEVNHALWKLVESCKYSEESIQLEYDFAKLIDMQEKHGFPFDEAAAAKLYAELVQARLEITKQLCEVFPPTRVEGKTPQYWEDELTGRKFTTKKEAAREFKARYVQGQKAGPNRFKLIDFNPGSRRQIADRLIAKYGWKPTAFTDSGEVQVDESILATLPWPEARVLERYLVVDKRIGQIAEGDEAWLKLVKKGRIHGRVNPNGAVTGRCTHSKPNQTAVPKVQVKKRDGKKVVLKGEEGGWGWECRSLFTAPPGMVLVGCDAAGLEMRCLAHFLAFYDGGAYAKLVLDGDPHEANRIALDIDSRDTAKTWFYAWCYGAWFHKLGLTVGVSAEEITQLKANPEWAEYAKATKRFLKVQTVADIDVARTLKGKMLSERFAAKIPAFGQLRGALEARVIAQWGSRWPPRNGGRAAYIRGLDGRRLYVRKLNAVLNTLLQHAGAIAMKKALIILHTNLTAKGYVYGKDFAYCSNNHDEWQIATRPDIATEVGREAESAITAAGAYFKFRCPLAGEFKVGRTWAETH